MGTAVSKRGPRGGKTRRRRRAVHTEPAVTPPASFVKAKFGNDDSLDAFGGSYAGLAYLEISSERSAWRSR